MGWVLPHVRLPYLRQTYRGDSRNLPQRFPSGLRAGDDLSDLPLVKAKAFNLAIKEWESIRGNPVMKVSLETENSERDRWLREGEGKRLLGAFPVCLRESLYLP